MPVRSLAFLVAALAFTILPTRGQDKKAVPPPPLPPQFPTLTTPVGLGVTAGGKAELTLTGTNLADATEVRITADGVKATLVKDSAKADRIGVTVEAPKGTPVGLYQLRVVTKNGVTSFRPISVDELPEVEKKAGNNKKATPMPLAGPCVVTGNIAVESSDFYLVKAAAGQRLTFEAVARRIGSPLDPVIILHDAKSGREMPTLYADDTPGLQADARLTHTFPSAMDVIVEIRDTTYRGGGDYVYRLRIGDFPGGTTAFPLAVEKDKSAAINFTGPNLDGVKPVTVKGTGTVVLASPRREGGVGGWAVPVLVSPHPELTEQEPNNEAAKANKLPVPGGVSARFAAKGDLDYFAFPGKKGQKLELTARTYELNSPAEVLVRVVDAKGAELARSNPTQPVARAEFTPGADGEFYAVAEHLNYAYGPSEVYHLTIRPAVPSFEVALGADRVDVTGGGVAAIPVVGLTKLNGFNAAVELSVVSDSLVGTLTLPVGANPLPATPLTLTVSLKPGAKPGVIPFTVKATAKDVERTADIAEVVRTTLSGLPNVPPEMTTQLFAFAAEKPLFALAVAFEKPEVAKGGTLKGKVTAKRADGFADEIPLTAVNLPANVTAKVKPIAKGASEVEIEVTAAAAATGPATFSVRGTTKTGGRDYAFVSPPASMTVTEPKKK
ncbi:hypothetical protein [Limnoglobus roseus]|uniref:Pre-peptidase n=1 Tax=Limnoglobus roseus TaxID=2598579 RepID=A0A5C1A735_9BACT|nr:hypothetical protein [Limnoglobus roseus]QEL13816.1 pre-peptidase [Limnoglobus roseus]